MKELVNASEARAKSREVKERNTETAIQELIECISAAVDMGRFEMNKVFSYPINLTPIKEYFTEKGYGVEIGYTDFGRVTITWY